MSFTLATPSGQACAIGLQSQALKKQDAAGLSRNDTLKPRDDPETQFSYLARNHPLVFPGVADVIRRHDHSLLPPNRAGVLGDLRVEFFQAGGEFSDFFRVLGGEVL